MIKTYKYEYNFYEAEACIKIDDQVLSLKDCKEALAFFTWEYDKNKDPYDELGRLYCTAAMLFATQNNANVNGVITHFKDAEGFLDVCGKSGITLTQVAGIDFSEIQINRTL